MNLSTITISQIHSWRPCNMAAGRPYSRKNLKKLFGGKESIGVLDLLALPIPAEDRQWVVLRLEVLTERELRLLACKFAGHALHRFEKKFPGDKRPREAIAVAKRYAGGKATRDELERAGAAAGDAAWAAAGAAARAAAWAAAWATGAGATGAAAWDAAGAAAGAAGAAWAAEKEWQIQTTIKFLRKCA